ncbi:hypothetical protein F5H01DRAFT_371582 [Linnemannia elongata]|nr:hypothetical protein F5H01DRAFT_371582 [Linnemannia elongata]
MRTPPRYGTVEVNIPFYRRESSTGRWESCKQSGSHTNLHEHWPTLTVVLERVFAKSHYDIVNEAIAEENMKDPVVRYIMSIIDSYSHYFSFNQTVPADINERQWFVELWCLIRGAMTMTRLETRYLEIFITGAQEHKNWARDDITEAKRIGQFADGAIMWEGS